MGHRVLGRVLHVVVGVAEDAGVREIGRDAGAHRIHAPADPDGLLVRRRHHQDLGHVERPGVVAAEVVHVVRRGDDKQVQTGLVHAGPRPGQPVGVLRARERFDHCRRVLSGL